MNYYACIDIGGTAIKYGLINSEGTIVLKNEMPTEAKNGGPSILKRVINIVTEFSQSKEICGICISTAGMVDVNKGEIFYASPLIPDYTGTQYKKVMEEKFHVPCTVENDVNCAGLAENISGAAKGSQSTLCLTVGTGIGGCIIIDGKVFRGFSNSACEVGYMNLGDSDFQSLGASSVLASKVCQIKQESGWNGKRIFESAKNGDRVCIDAIDEMVDVLGKGIANICYVINPQTVVLGGGIMAQEEYLLPRIRKAVDKYLVESIAKRTEIKMAAHRNDAGMLGAYYYHRSCM